MRTAALACLALVATGLAGCGTASPRTDDGRLPVVVSFYPLEYLAERIGGDAVDVTSLTKPGQEPHDVDLAPKEIGRASDAALGIYSRGMQPAVDEAFVAAPPQRLLDLSSVADLPAEDANDTHAGETEAEHADHADHADEGAEHADEGGQHADEHAGHDHGDTDPHFWLDPVRYATAADRVAAALTEADPARRAQYAAGLASLRRDLAALDADLRTGLARCARTDVVTSHAAFGYLTHAYGLRQVAVSGISPDAEPEPRRLAQIARFVREDGVTTVYTETLASPAVARTVATETGARTAVLDPVEGVTPQSAAPDYLGLMRANLAALRKGQGCS